MLTESGFVFAESNASSEQSTHSDTGSHGIMKNTLLAMDSSAHDKQAVRKILKNIEDEFHIDRSLLNPDDLWKRPQAG